MSNSIIDGIKDLTTTRGRIPRSTFWWFHAMLFVLLLIPQFLAEDTMIPGFGFVFLLMLVVRIIVEIKRWHDRDKSGWWFLIGLIPVVGWLWVIIECGFLPGTQGENRFGPDPIPK
jgi:uncharacterized membrane protein YhaH (DUF805 family)